MGLKCSEEGEQGAPAREAEGRRPKDPGITLDWSERLIEIGMNRCGKKNKVEEKLTCHRISSQ